jgi:hypothetical protein
MDDLKLQRASTHVCLSWQLFTLPQLHIVIRNRRVRFVLMVLAVAVLGVAYFFNRYSDDCIVGNLTNVKQTGLLME